jgi:hypothetical protein
MKKKHEKLLAIPTAIGLVLLAYWLYSHNTLAGVSGALILAYITGAIYLILALFSWLIAILTAIHSLIITLPMISTIHTTITPIFTPITAFLAKIGPFKWLADKTRNIKPVKMVECKKCRKETPAEGKYCCHCGRKNVSH